MRITFVLKHANLAGGVRVVAVYAERLAQRGHDVLVTSAPWPRPDVRSVLKSLALRGRLPASERGKPSHLSHAEIPHRILERDRAVTDADVPDADVVISTWWETAEWVARLSPGKGAKCAFLQGFESHDALNAVRIAETWRLPFHKIVVSRWLADLARERFGDARVCHVPNGVDGSQFFAPPRERGTHPTVGFVYSADPFKRADLVIEAFRRLRQRLPDVKVLSFGAMPPPRPPLPDGCEFHLRPPQESLRVLYSRCDAWVCGSDSEGFSLPLLEAMACGVPVVSTRAGGPEDFVEEGVNGHLVGVGDAAKLADRIHGLLTQPPSEWRAMSEAARTTAARYTWETSTDRFEEALRIAVERSERGEIAGGRRRESPPNAAIGRRGER